jgi:hypothetical protein
MQKLGEAVGKASNMVSGEESAEEAPSGTAHKTAGIPQTDTHVVSSLGEADHRTQEQQGADHHGYYQAQAKLESVAQKAKDAFNK